MSKLPLISSKDAITNLIKYSQSHGNVLQKYSASFYLDYFDHNTIQELQQRMGKYHQHNEIEFVTVMTNFILHPGNQTLFLVISLIDIYGKITEEVPDKDKVTFKDFTRYLCKLISQKNSELHLLNKELPPDRGQGHRCRPRDIDINAPTVYSHEQRESPKISKTLKKLERRVDSDKPLHLFEINRKSKEIIAIGRLSSQISIFNMQLERTTSIVPQCFRVYNRSAAIMWMAFSQKQQRIGCIITHLGLAFWDCQDEFATEKVIKKSLGDRIYYLEVLEQWITTSHNSIYLWDLKLEKIKQTIVEAQAVALHHIQQISHLRCMTVSYTMKDNHKWLVVYKNQGLKIASKLKLGNSGAQKIHYHKVTQTILLTGINELPVYQIDNYSFDLSPLALLDGHQSIITSISDLEHDLVATGDDRGTVRIWDLNKLRCQQVLKIAHSLAALQCFGHSLIFADSRLNLVQLEQIRQKVPLQEQLGLFTFFNMDLPEPQFYIFTNVSCRVHTVSDGRVRRVVELCGAEEEVINVNRFGNSFLLSTSKCSLQCYSQDLELKWKMQSPQYFRQQVIHVRSDVVNRFFTTVTKDGNINVWPEGRFQEEGPRKSITQANGSSSHQISLFELSQKYGMMASCDKNSHVKIWDYESCKLTHVFELEAAPCALKIAEQQPLLAVGCPSDKVYIYRLSRKNHNLLVEFSKHGHLRFPHSKLNSLVSLQSTSQVLTPSQRYLQTKTLSQGIAFYTKQRTNTMSVGYGTGHVITFDIDPLCSSAKCGSSFKKFNVQRPVRQILSTQLSNKQYQVVAIPETQSIQGNKLKMLWNKNIHKEAISSMSTLQNNLVTLSLEGQLRITTVQQGDLLASLNIRHALPSLWKIQFSQEQKLCSRVYRALSLVSDIVSHKNIQREDKEVFNINWFLKLICTKNGHSSFKKRRKSVKVVPCLEKNTNKQHTPYQSLKSMQAFRRVSLIRQAGTSTIESDFSSQIRHLNSLRDKEDMLKLLSPYYFSSYCSFTRQDQEKFSSMVAKSACTSPNISPQKLDKLKEPKLEGLTRKTYKKYQSRSLSQTIRSIDPPPSISNEDTFTRQIKSEFQGQEPIKALNEFVRHLKDKVPKQNKFKKHLKKISGLNPKF